MATTCWGKHRFVLSNGLSLPSVGLGTFKIRRENEIETSVVAAVAHNGYKLIDTAAVYRNESLIATSLKGIYQDPKLNLPVRFNSFV